MPTIPKTTTETASTLATADTLNAIRTAASPSYQALVPVSEDSVESLRGIGNILLANPNLRNEFINTLYNRIALVLITSKLYTNPLATFKKGYLELGETVEEIFVRLAQPHAYDIDESETNVLKREIPDVLSAFHTINYKVFYKRTIQNNDLRQAFLSWGGLEDFIAKMVDSMYSAAAYDEFLVTKYLLSKLIVEGFITPVTTEVASAQTASSIVTTIKGEANQLTFMSSDYNIAGVENFTDFYDMFILVNAKFDAIMDVNVLATAFNMDRASFLGHKILIDNLGKVDEKRLEVLVTSTGGTYTPFTDAQKEMLSNVSAVIVSRDFFMMFDNLNQNAELYNGEGLYWNYWYHVWKIVSASPFANAIAFTSDTSSVTGITVTPSTASVSKGSSLQLTATVTGTGIVNQLVDWSINIPDGEGASINSMGLLTTTKQLTASSITVTCTSRVDSSVSGTATITIA